MKQTIVYTLDQDDPSFTFVEHAANRLINFKQHTDDLLVKSFNRFINGEFTDTNLADVAKWLRLLAERARERCEYLRKLPSPTENDIALSDGILQAAENAEQAADDMMEMVSEIKQQNRFC